MLLLLCVSICGGLVWMVDAFAPVSSTVKVLLTLLFFGGALWIGKAVGLLG